MGGSWDRLIQTIKRHLGEVLKERYPKGHVLRTLFCEIENIINSRPITYNSADPNDPLPLTPNDILIGHSSSFHPITPSNDKDLIVLSDWRAIQKLADMFWKRWMDEYIPSILNAKKWMNECKNLFENDIVIIVESNLL